MQPASPATNPVTNPRRLQTNHRIILQGNPLRRLFLQDILHQIQKKIPEEIRGQNIEDLCRILLTNQHSYTIERTPQFNRHIFIVKKDNDDIEIQIVLKRLSVEQKRELGILKNRIASGRFGRVFYIGIMDLSSGTERLRVTKNQRLKEKIGATEVSEQHELQNEFLMNRFAAKFAGPERVVMIRNVHHRVEAGKVHMIMEHIRGGELFDLIRRFPRRVNANDQCLVLGIMKYLTDTLALLHAHNLAHRDIKGENILLTEDFIPKLVDFACATQDESSIEFLGTEGLLAPEVAMVTQENPYNPCQADVISFGILILKLLHIIGMIPRVKATRNFIYRYVLNNDRGNFGPEYGDNYDAWHNFQRRSTNVITKLLLRIFDPDPNTRITAEEISEHRFFEEFPYEFDTLEEKREAIADLKSRLST